MQKFGTRKYHSHKSGPIGVDDTCRMDREHVPLLFELEGTRCFVSVPNFWGEKLILYVIMTIRPNNQNFKIICRQKLL